nr:MAG TPA_asm: PsbL protein [Caudoviricetes sp.]
MPRVLKLFILLNIYFPLLLIFYLALYFSYHTGLKFECF